MSVIGYKKIKSQGGANAYCLGIDAHCSAVDANGNCTVTGSLKMYCNFSSTPYFGYSHNLTFKINDVSKADETTKIPRKASDWSHSSNTVGGTKYTYVCTIGTWSQSVHVGYDTTKNVSLSGSYSISKSQSYLPVRGTHSVSGTITTGSRPGTFTNTIDHWSSGYQHSEGNNGAKTAFKLGETSWTQHVNTTCTMGMARAITIPNGFYLSKYRTKSLSGSWADYNIDDSFTQPAQNCSFEYWYDPYNYNIIYEMNGGTNNENNPSSYNVLYGVTFQNPTRSGYTFSGWQINGDPVTGINPGANATFSDVNDLYTKCAERTTGNIIVQALWIPLPPSNLIIEGQVLSATSIFLQWSAEGNEITNYKVFFEGEDTARYEGLNTSGTFNVEPNTTYSIWFTAENAGGEGTSQIITLTTPELTEKTVDIKINNVWINGTFYLKTDNKWQTAFQIFGKVNEHWREGE